jgi:hypothetical protein
MEGIQSIIRGGGLGTPTQQLPLQHRTSLPELRSKLLGVLRLEFFFLKRCEDVGDAHPRFNVVGDDFKVANGGGLNFPSFNSIARPHPRCSGPNDGFPSFLVLSLSSSPGPIALRGDRLVHAMTT